MNAKKEFRSFLIGTFKRGWKTDGSADREATEVFLRWRGLNADTGSSIEDISDIHLHKAHSSFTFLLRPRRPAPLSPCLDVCFLLHPLSESTSTFCSLCPSISAQHALFRFYTSFCPSSLYLSTLSIPLHLRPPSPHTAYLLFVFLRGCLLHARISLLNLVLQVTILLLSPRYFSCRYSTLLLFLVNAFVFVTERTSGTSPLFFCIR